MTNNGQVWNPGEDRENGKSILRRLQMCSRRSGGGGGGTCEWFDITTGVKLTNRFHVAVYLSSNRSQMTSKCGKNKKVAHEAIAECVTDVLTTF